ncbi:MAG: hypothetical protein ACPGMR_07875 [Pontibacterium sp.]
MTSLPAIYVWDNDYFNVRSTMLRRCSVALVIFTLALLLFGSSVLLTVPLVVLLIVLVVLQKRFDKIIRDCTDASVAFSPLSFVVYFPRQNYEQSFSLEQVARVEPITQLGYSGLKLTLTETEDPNDSAPQSLKLIGFSKTPDLAQRLSEHLTSSA